MPQLSLLIENDYEDNPGIADKDIFCNNDNHVGNVHTCDVHTLVPIFWEGEVMGWAGDISRGSRIPEHLPPARCRWGGFSVMMMDTK